MTLSTESLTRRLDTLQADLPPIPAKSLELTRASVRRANDVAVSVADRIGEFARPVASTATTATRTVVGQARSAVDRSVATMRRTRNETIGQFEAQVGRTAKTLRDETTDLLDDAAKAVAPETTNPASLQDLSKAELYERAQNLDIEGRSAMSKDELVAALRSA